ncbi:helix-turn-helix domain-containing protein [Commensalibacter nepenthis]
MHRKTKLTLYHREEIWRLHHQEKVTVTDLAKRFMVSRSTIYAVLRRARLQLFLPMSARMSVIKRSNMALNALLRLKKHLRTTSDGKPKNITNLILGRWCMSRLNSKLGSIFL